jgi:Uma2 family endonuclease
MSTVLEKEIERPDTFVVPPFPVLRFTLAEYWALRDSGFLDHDIRYEFLEGWIVPKVTQKPPHAWAVSHVDQVIELPSEWFMRVQCAINTDDSEPEPDVAIVRSPDTRYVTRHPRRDDIGLLIEVSEATLYEDRRKAEIYAADGIAVYWIINLVDRQIEVHTDPDAANRDYRNREVFTPGQSIEIELDGNVIQTIAVDDLLPPVIP